MCWKNNYRAHIEFHLYGTADIIIRSIRNQEHELATAYCIVFLSNYSSVVSLGASSSSIFFTV